MRLIKIFFLCLAVIALSSCKSKKNDDVITPAQELYKHALQLLEEKRYSKAAEEFGKVFFQHPGNEITPQAELMQAYSLYLNDTYDEALDVLDIFIKLHPMHKDIAYAYYLKALSSYKQISSVKLDQSRTFSAKETLEDVIKRFPGSKYAADCMQKIKLVDDHLAGKEMEVGRYYLAKKNPIAAIKRFQAVVDSYQTTSHTAEALYRLVESYLMLGIEQEALKYAAVLGYNYPDSRWYEHSYKLMKHTKQ